MSRVLPSSGSGPGIVESMTCYFWKQVAAATKCDRIRVPILGIGGWAANVLRKAVVDNYQA